jgi:hypothetical protein
MLYTLVTALAIVAHAKAGPDAHIRALHEAILSSERRIADEKIHIADATLELRASGADQAILDKGRQLGSGWQSYMNQAIATGSQFAVAGATGQGDFGELSQETSDNFSALNHNGEQQAPAAAVQSAQPKQGVSTASNDAIASASNNLQASIVSAVEETLGGPIEAFTGVKLGRVTPPAAAASPADSASPATKSGSSSLEDASQDQVQQGAPTGHASWQQYMQAGIETGLAFAQAGAGTAAGTNDPSTEYGVLSQLTADKFSTLNHQGDDAPAQAAPAAQTQPEAAAAEAWGSDDAWGSAEVPEEKAGWTDYMNTGVSTGINFAKAGADTADGSNDPETAFGDLSKQTGSSFEALGNGGQGAQGPAQQLQAAAAWAPASQPAEQKGTGAAAQASQHQATWQDYLFAGINTGILFATTGAGTAAGTNDPETVYNDISQSTANTFASLSHQGEQPGRRRALFVDHQDRF